MVKQLFLSLFLLLASIAVVSAQRTVESAVKEARDRFSDVKNRSIELERVKRSSNKMSVSERFTLNFAEIKKDFEEIQKINSDSLQAIAVQSPLNYGAIFKFVAEVNQRAVRLKSNLFSADSEPKNASKDKQKIVVESQNIPTLIKELDEFINSFVHSSLFQNINVVNSQDSLKAQNDLEKVIKISFAIKETAKKLKKADFNNN